MRKNIVLLIILAAAMVASAQSADLYRVMVTDEITAGSLRDADIEPVTTIYNGYLVLAETRISRLLEESGIKMQLIARDLTTEELAIDLRLDRENAGRYDMLYEESGLRLFRIESPRFDKIIREGSLMPVRNEKLTIEYRSSVSFDKSRLQTMEDLQTLIDQVVLDSLQSYTEALQAFGDRYTASASNNASRDWLAAKFVEFGYDSVVIDSFVTSIYGTPTECQNVVACKIGAALPEHYIVVGAHRDAVSGSPGADDNGSGSAGVLEIARILRNYETDLTFVFVLFDAEEQGLHGSYHFADEALANGDSIVYMFNMDMIADEDNSTSAKLYHGSELTYTELLLHLADSLLGLNAVLMGTAGGSDHYPFLQNGYEATFLHEYIFSSVYHSYRDSTTHLSFPYHTKMVKAGLATVYTVSETYIPGPQLKFEYPDGVPSTLTPGVQTTFRVAVSGINGGTPVSGSGRLHYAVDGGEYTETTMTESSPDVYQAVLPALSCGEMVAFYFSAEEVDSGLFYSPSPGNPFTATPATAESMVFFDDFEQDLAWTVSGGQWQRGSPTGGGGAYGGPDPVGGFNSAGCYGYNLNGDYGNNLPEYHLTSPAIDCSEISGTTLRFMRWLGVEQPAYDHAYIRVSNDGANWTDIWANTSEVADYEWILQEFDISDLADGESTVYLRWTMGQTDGGWTYCGWNIDDVDVRGNVCEGEPGPLTIITETMPDWTVGRPFSQQLIATGGVGAKTWVDKYNDLSTTGLGLSSGGLLSGTPVSDGQITFTAEVTDDESNTDEKQFTFSINPELEITTTALDDAEVGVAYSYQLQSSGGTGAIVWSDAGNDLAGSGLSLSASGEVQGIPTAAATLEFTAHAEDIAGSVDERLFSMDILAAGICGDANDDGDVNISDAVYIIAYIFQGGPPPAWECLGDANDDGPVDLSDAVYIISYIFKGGPPPLETCCD